jgi:phosphoglucosamine mutase
MGCQVLKYFGTDGIRGKVGEAPLTLEFVTRLGWAVGSILPASPQGKCVLIGKDTRISGYMFEAALQAGLSASGTNVILAGPIPSPAVAYLTHTLNAQIGIVISASHNSKFDNGIKFYSSDGYKISEQLELQIEKCLELPISIVDSKLLGKASRSHEASARYIEYCKSAVSHHADFSKLKVIVDCANGATYRVAPKIFNELGACLTSINITPDGLNINEKCGSLHPALIQQQVMNEKADVGVAFDGDGDRVILIDHQGEILDGDEILYIIIKKLLREKRFKGGIVGTQMNNMGFELALNEFDIPLVRVEVGDQYVVKALREHNWLLGGETSGHIIYLNTSPAADGIIAALLVLEEMTITGKSLNELKQGINKFPQRIVNIPYNNHMIPLDNTIITAEIKLAEKKLCQTGRILLRYSGTEPILRLMVEGKDALDVEIITNHLSEIITQLINVRH